VLLLAGVTKTCNFRIQEALKFSRFNFKSIF